jgi:hypothetical protein
LNKPQQKANARMESKPLEIKSDTSEHKIEEYWIGEHKRCLKDFLKSTSFEQLCERSCAYIRCHLKARAAVPNMFADYRYDLDTERLLDQKIYKAGSEKEYRMYAELLSHLIKTMEMSDGFDSSAPFETLACWCICQNHVRMEDGSDQEMHLLDSSLQYLETYTSSGKVCLAIGGFYLERGRYVEALRLFDKVCSVSKPGKEFDEAMVKSCKALVASGDHSRAFDCISKVKETCPLEFANYVQEHLKDYALARQYFLKTLSGEGAYRFLWMAKDHPDAFTYHEKIDFFDFFIAQAARQSYEANANGNAGDLKLTHAEEFSYNDCIYIPIHFIYEYRNAVAIDSEKLEKVRGRLRYSLVVTGDIVKRVLPDLVDVADWCYETAAKYFVYEDSEKNHLVECIKQSKNAGAIICRIKTHFSGLKSRCYKQNYEIIFGQIEQNASDFPLLLIPSHASTSVVDAVVACVTK